ncbi:pyridoxamine 5'-phosphate oxidase family protein [Lacinutrix neustonica]|uniref:Pyridoxamine 5'-phosphate oxidase family protein n=1 Tax=Lacinutrix neustonica TaxID=2980107 RepID=A0A9E8MYV4_9FLAO|nr:pyridoxamine 5'-phosphate oxidase family protein [Lacinutrix neustonica]WAC02775.1 pyridoxamine 5'-phosphate oxidase family protein [Lacinutrix neustonica]
MIKNLVNKESLFILNHNYIGHLGYIYHDRPYVVPITYYFDEKEGVIVGYSGEGHKINAMRKHNFVSLEVAEIKSVNHWQSVLVEGAYEELEGSFAKAKLHEFSLGVKDVILNTEQRDVDYINEFSAKIYKDDVPIVFIIRIAEITGKKRRF